MFNCTIDSYRSIESALVRLPFEESRESRLGRGEGAGGGHREQASNR
jgi:hypothetical protein